MVRAHSRGPLGSKECKMYSVGAEGARGSAVWSRKIRGARCVLDSSLAKDKEFRTAAREDPGSCALAQLTGPRTTGWRPSRSRVASERPGPSPSRFSPLPGKAIPASPNPLSLRPYARYFLGPVSGSWDARRGQTRPVSSYYTWDPSLIISRPTASAGSRFLFALQSGPQPRAPRSLWSWASHLSALNLRFHVCKMGARVSTSRGLRCAPGPWIAIPALPSAGRCLPRPIRAPNPLTDSRAAELRVRPSVRVGRGGRSGFLFPLLRDWEKNRGLC